MASRTVKKETSSISYITNFTIGTQNIEVLNSTGLKIGKTVYVSIRVKVLNNISDAMNVPLVRAPYTPRNAGYCPSIIYKSDDKASYSGYVNFKAFSGYYFVVQKVSSNLTANTTLDIFFVYDTDE